MNNNTERDDLIGKEDMDILADIAKTEIDPKWRPDPYYAWTQTLPTPTYGRTGR